MMLYQRQPEGKPALVVLLKFTKVLSKWMRSYITYEKTSFIDPNLVKLSTQDLSNDGCRKLTAEVSCQKVAMYGSIHMMVTNGCWRQEFLNNLTTLSCTGSMHLGGF